MNILNKLIGVATLPLDIASDVFTLSGTLNEKGSATHKKIDDLMGKNDINKEELAKKKMALDEVQKAKEKLESEIIAKVQEFMDTYKVSVTDIEYDFTTIHSFCIDRVVAVVKDIKIKIRG